MAPLWSPNLHGRKVKTEIEEIEKKGEKKPPRIGASQKCRPGRRALGGDVGLGEPHTLLAQLLHVRGFEVGVGSISNYIWCIILEIVFSKMNFG